MIRCSVGECAREAKNAGMCWGHYKRNYKYGDPFAGGVCKKKIGEYQPVKRDIPESILAYWAGFFDGEGSVYIGKFLRASISQLTENDQVLREIAETYDGCLTFIKHDDRRDMTSLQLTTMRAYEFLRDILPYLRQKHNKAAELIRLIDNKIKEK